MEKDWKGLETGKEGKEALRGFLVENKIKFEISAIDSKHYHLEILVDDNEWKQVEAFLTGYNKGITDGMANP